MTSKRNSQTYTFTQSINESHNPRWRDSEQFDQLNEEEQLKHIYQPQNKTNDQTLAALTDDTESNTSFITLQSLDKNWRQIKLYIIIKAIIWLGIVAFIFWENFHKQDVLTASGPPFQPSDAQQWCCACYNYAMEQQSKEVYSEILICLS